MLTSLQVKNFKSLENVEIELGKTVVFVGPNNSGKTTALQALALWEIGLRKWLEKRASRETPEKRPGVTINRRDLIAIPVPDSNLLWRDLHVRTMQRKDGRQDSRNIRIDILVTGVTEDSEWQCGFEFDYANPESLYCRPLRKNEDPQAERMVVPDCASKVRMAFLPPMSGLAAAEDRLPEGAVNVRIGEGRSAEVLRNLCFQIHSESEGNWDALVAQVRNLFGVTLNAPQFLPERGQITMSYMERDIEFDLVSSGRGLQQTLLLLAYLYTHPRSVLLLDEPDAHLEILRQRQLYQMLTQTAQMRDCQVIAASHSEVLLNEAAGRDVVVAFVGRPHRINDRGSEVLKSLNAIGFDQYYQAEQTGWVLYLGSPSDLAVLQAFAALTEHAAQEALKQPFVHYVGQTPAKARDHFFGLREARPDLVGIAILDSIPQELTEDGPLGEMQWRQREFEHYLCLPETLLAYAEQMEGTGDNAEEGPLFEVPRRERRRQAMQEAMEEVAGGDDLRGTVFEKYFSKMGLPDVMEKTDLHMLARFVPRERMDGEITEKLDRIVEVARRARTRATTL